ncbi:hypothetical protein [Marichromatium gracile]|uniref:AAA ATPase-like protein n=1 Tax=Marichromatium gracile TaxID=1048 RepID=A0A4R4ABP6_MARGR|nr:hypothetical protein [Marichromatium gracile]TCW36458.1 hypothetical protein EDC29_104251 [Marichromatium gracile]
MEIEHDVLVGLEKLLLSLPEWGQREWRLRFAQKALGKKHPVIERVRWGGTARDVAWDLVSNCEDFPQPTPYNVSPLCSLLIGVRDNDGIFDKKLSDSILFFEKKLRCDFLDNPEWFHDPYPGMKPLMNSQSSIFFGRKKEVRDLVEKIKLNKNRLILVAGASGAGKSSLVHAGVWAKLSILENEPIAGSSKWVITSMTPACNDRDPFKSLVASLKDVPGFNYPYEEADALRQDLSFFSVLIRNVLCERPKESRWLLILDQFEELFTSIEPGLAKYFIDEFLAAAIANDRFNVVATVRSDFLGNCLSHDLLIKEINGGAIFTLGLPGAAAMVEIIKYPISKVRLSNPIEIEEELVDKLVSDAGGHVGGLAILAFVLKDLYGKCKDSGKITSKDYEEGLDFYVKKYAENAVKKSGVSSEEVLPRIFSRLLAIQHKGPPAKLREKLDFWKEDPDAICLIDALADKDVRLLVKSNEGVGFDLPEKDAVEIGCAYDATVEVAHEALFNAWPALSKWINDSRIGIMRRPQVEFDADVWDSEGRPDRRLYKKDIIVEIRKEFESAFIWDCIARNSNVAHFLARDNERELFDLTLHAFCEKKSNDDLVALLRTLTAESRSAEVIQLLGSKIAKEKNEVADWLRSGITAIVKGLEKGLDIDWHWRRLRLGDLLAALGDCREGVGVRDGLPNIVWKDIPAGRFVWQEKEIRETGFYKIAQYPVTNAQYSLFLESKDYADPKWWGGV